MSTVPRRLAILALVVLVAPPAFAQGPAAGAPSSVVDVQPAAATREPAGGEPGVAFHSIFTDLGRDLVRLPSKSTALTLGIGGALALAVHPADRTLTSRATLTMPLDRVFEAGELAGSGWVQVGGALATFVVAKATRSPRLQIVGADLLRAQILNMAMTQGVKFAVSRPRPDDGRYSFPSGHASATFANATVLHRHFGWKIGVPAYGLAAYVAASRLQENRHFASDVIFGAAVGIVAGRTVTVGRGPARFVVAPMAIAGGGGLTLTLLP